MKRYESSAWINAITVLGPGKLTVRTGYRDRFVVAAAPDDFPAAPALLIHLGKRIERVFEGSKKNASGKPAEPTSVTPATPVPAAPNPSDSTST